MKQFYYLNPSAEQLRGATVGINGKMRQVWSDVDVELVLCCLLAAGGIVYSFVDKTAIGTLRAFVIARNCSFGGRIVIYLSRPRTVVELGGHEL